MTNGKIPSKVIDRTMLTYDTSGFDIKDHFPTTVRKTIEMPTKSRKGVEKIGFPDVGKTKKNIDY
ncbi:MAG: hypothetical protein LBN11_07815 [Tannerella sp.]|nr:hypothetical protein [Tannerella sp.]